MIPNRNAELRRLAWLELTPQRLVATPLVLGLILLLVSLTDEPLEKLPSACLMLFVGVTVLWGTKLASDSLNSEFLQGTWDSQRISGMGAWQMTVGKLVGGPVFAWYGGALCLAAYALTVEWSWPALRALIGGIVAAVTFHAVALLLELVAWRKLPRMATTPRARGVSILLLLMIAPQLLVGLRRGEDVQNTIWYGLTIPTPDFALACGVLAMAWSMLGLYRAMREELAYRDPPTAWIAFLLFLFAFSGGWFYGRTTLPVFPELQPAAAHLAACLTMALIANYALLFSERKDWVRMRRLVACWSGQQRRRAWELTPKWLATFGLTVITTIVLGLVALITEPPMRGIAAASAGLAFVAFLMRDGALVLGLNFTRDQARADSAALLYLLVLYALLPGLLLAVGLPALGALFWPPLVYEQPAWLALIALETGGALDFAIRRWRKLPV